MRLEGTNKTDSIRIPHPAMEQAFSTESLKFGALKQNVVAPLLILYGPRIVIYK